MESLGQAAARLLRRLERAAKTREKGAGRVEQSNVFPDATERRSATDAGSFDGDFTTPGIVCGTPGNAHQGDEIQDSASRSAGGGEDGPSSRLAAPIRPANDNQRAHAAPRETRS